MSASFNRQAALAIVYEAIDLVNAQRPGDVQLIRSPDLVLVDDGGELDSLELSLLVLAVERKVKEITAIDIDIFDADMDKNLTKLRTPTTLVEAIMQKVY